MSNASVSTTAGCTDGSNSGIDSGSGSGSDNGTNCTTDTVDDGSIPLQPGRLIRPMISVQVARQLVQDLYGLTADSVKEMNSYDDRNFFVTVEQDCEHNNPFIEEISSQGYVLKILNSMDSRKHHIGNVVLPPSSDFLSCSLNPLKSPSFSSDKLFCLIFLPEHSLHFSSSLFCHSSSLSSV